MSELASDRQLENEASGAFHLAVGFEETGRNVFYRMPVGGQNSGESAEFWAQLDALVASSEIVIDRPKGSAHPKWADLIYPLDYGFLDGTHSGDGEGIDVFVGSLADRALDAAVVAVDLFKRETELKLLLGCTATEKDAVLQHYRNAKMGTFLIERE